MFVPLIPALGRQKQAASLVYRVSSTTARATQRNPISKNKTKQNKTKQNKTKEQLNPQPYQRVTRWASKIRVKWSQTSGC